MENIIQKILNTKEALKMIYLIIKENRELNNTNFEVNMKITLKYQVFSNGIKPKLKKINTKNTSTNIKATLTLWNNSQETQH